MAISTIAKAIIDVAAASKEGAAEIGDIVEKADVIVRRTDEVLEKLTM